MESPIISTIALIVSLVSLLLSVYFSIKTSRYTEITLKIESHAQQREYASAVREWGFEVIELLSDGLHLLERQGKFSGDEVDRLLSVQWRVSSAIDRGRLFVPNSDPELAGVDKWVAYRGYRQPTLNILVGAYNLLREATTERLVRSEELFGTLWDLRKAFVSELQLIVDPREMIVELERIRSEVTGGKL